MILRATVLALILLGMTFAEPCVKADTLSFSSPNTRQVIQRNASNQADLRVVGSWSGTGVRLEARAVVMDGATNNGVSTDWVVIVNAPTNGAFIGVLPNVAAGGWYRVEVRSVDADANLLISASVDRIGVGDILVTAGQSNAGGFGAPNQTPTDDRVSSYILATKRWQFGKDAQPDNSGGMGSGGSPWPILGSLLTASNHVPVGFVGVAYGGSALSQWVPGTSFFQTLTNALRAFGTNGVRAVL